MQHVLFLGHRSGGGVHRVLDQLVVRDPKTLPSRPNQQPTISRGHYMCSITRLTSLS